MTTYAKGTEPVQVLVPIPPDRCSKCHRWVLPRPEALPGVERTEIVLYGQYDCECGWGWRMGWAVEDLV